MHGASGAAARLAALAGVDGATRLYRLELAEAGAPLIVERWAGRERLAGGFTWTVDALSTRADLSIEEWLGRPARLIVRLADGGESVRSGLVREAACVGSDGGLARYRLALAPWTWLLGQGRHSRVFQDRGVAEILETVFADYAPLAAWGLSDETGPFLAAARPRGYRVQYRESDAAFIERMLTEEGLGWRLEEDAAAPAGHRLVVFADAALQPGDAGSLADGGVRFHRSDATEQRDAIQGIGLERRIGASRLTVLGSDYRTMRSVSASLPLGHAGHDAAVEHYDPGGAHAHADAAEAEHRARLMAEAAEARRERWIGHGTARSFRAGTWFRLLQAPSAQGREAAPPELLLVSVHHLGVNNLPVDLREAVRDALGDAPAWDAADAPDESAEAVLRTRAEAAGYANWFEAVDRARPWRPVLEDGTGARRRPRPTAPGYQTAIVVGPDARAVPSGARELHCDALGRIRVRFHWMEDPAPGTAQASCWLRVAQRYAGPGVGAQFLPRIGQEVLVAFLEGDIDRPVVVGALYNGRGEGGVPPTPGGAGAEQDASVYALARDQCPSAQANLAGGNAPPWHGMGAGGDAHRNAGAMWGIKSKEWGGQGHVRLVFDDSDGQLRLQLATTQAASELNLGHLVHQADNFRGSFRGEGFELRTDAWGTVRAESGLWLGAYPAPGDAPAGEAVGPAAVLSQACTLAEAFSRAAAAHGTVRLAAHEGAHAAGASLLAADRAPLAALLASVKTTVPDQDFPEAMAGAGDRRADAGPGRVPHTGDALLGLAAPAGIGFVAGQGLSWIADETLTLSSGGPGNFAIAGNLRVHAGQAIGLLAAAGEGAPAGPGLSLVTGEGDLDFQAQGGGIRIGSRDRLDIASAGAGVDLSAGKAIRLATRGGASLTIEGGHISVACPGEIRVRAGRHRFEGPTQLSREMNAWPRTRFADEYVVRSERTGKPLADTEVELRRADGAVLRLVTDAEGRLPRQQGEWIENVSLRVLGGRGS